MRQKLLLYLSLGFMAAWNCRAGSADLAPHTPASPWQILSELRIKLAPDPHVAVYQVDAELNGAEVVLHGEVDRAEARAETERQLTQAGYKVRNEIEVLPAAEIGSNCWAIACLSVANGREEPSQKAEMGTQVLMGHPVQLLETTHHWWLARSADGYLSWIERGGLAPCTRAGVEAWEKSPLLMVTVFEDRILSEPRAGAEPVSDVVAGDLLKRAGEQDHWFRVELPDGRAGFLPQSAAEDLSVWKASRHPTPGNIEHTGRTFLGRPYLWGGNSPKGMDCSGFTSLVFYLNGISLKRNASEQATQGELIPVDKDFSQLRKGDLLFFGWPGRHDDRHGISHVAIYLGDRQFIQSSERVRVSSFDPSSPIFDAGHARSLLFARRVLPQPATTP